MPNGVYQITETRLDSGGSAQGQSVTVFDSLGRELRSARLLLGGNWSQVLTEYDAFGRESRKSFPHWNTESPYWTQFSFDLIGRVYQEQRPVSSVNSSLQTTSILYEGLLTQITDPQGRTKSETVDMLGQLVLVRDADNNTITYEYDATGNRTKIIDPLGNQIRFVYDVRGRRLSSIDPNSGTWSYAHNAFDDLTSQTDAKGQTTTFQYDGLGRMTARYEIEGVTSWVWDTAANGLGLLATVSFAPAGGSGLQVYAEAMTYDSLSRLAAIARNIDGVNYVINRSYDTFGRLSVLTYPASHPSSFRFAVKYVYEPGSGRLQKVVDNVTQTLEYWRANSTDPAGSVNDELLGNGIDTASVYDRVTGYLDFRSSGYLGGTEVQNLSYLYDQVGNLIRRRDERQDLTEEFYYDNLYRLDYSRLQTSGGAWATNLDVSYNAIGNITYRSDVGNYVYPASGAASVRPHAVTTAGFLAYSYDANGNATLPSGAAATWSSYNLLRHLDTDPSVSGDDTATFWYDADRARYKQVALTAGVTETTRYVGSIFEAVTKSSSGVVVYKHHVLAGELPVMIHIRRSNGAVANNYLHRDHLGSVDVITDDARNVLVRLSFDAFGNRRSPVAWSGAPSAADWTRINDLTHRGFTNHEHIIESFSLVHMNGRIYDPIIGRFLSPDPVIGDVTELQDLNAYTYVRNNPLSYVDPSGYFLKKLFKRLSDAFDNLSIVRLFRAIADLARGEVSTLVGWVVSTVCSYLTQMYTACGFAGDAVASALSSTGSGNSARGPPGRASGTTFEPPPAFSGRCVAGGCNVPAGAISANADPASVSRSIDGMARADVITGAADLVLGSIPGYRLAKALLNPQSTWVDYAEGVASLIPTGRLASLGVRAVVKASGVTKAGRYEFPDQAAGGKPYVGQSSNIPKRLNRHGRTGRYAPGTATTTAVPGGRTAREISEHQRIQEITGGVPARQSDSVSNQVDPIGPRRRHLLPGE